ncbi:MAG: precorrin-8X methylmutase [Desulfobacteraceae bacterium 4484_190.1]|nr:MAG: precorrin-8X methylmutase [Desulfobacteraceae bacterium 4484_190.1]
MGDRMQIDRITVEPHDIEKRSFEIIDSEVPEPRPFKGKEWRVVRRMIHTTADFELLSLAVFHPNALKSGMEALKSGCIIVTDTEMARKGITVRRMEKLGCRVKCYINDPDVKETALRKKTTRALAAVDHAASCLNHHIFVIGNAPTALLRLLDLIEKGRCKPALIVGIPVGFVNAAESKELLLNQNQIPFITIRGRKGGSALAATVINELAEISINDK